MVTMSKGETISPQKVKNFNSFSAILAHPYLLVSHFTTNLR